MKTTIEIPDSLFRQVKARAALQGVTLKLFLIEALQSRITADHGRAQKQEGWRTVFGAAPKGSVSEVQHLIDAEFSKVNPDEWK